MILHGVFPSKYSRCTLTIQICHYQIVRIYQGTDKARINFNCQRDIQGIGVAVYNSNLDWKMYDLLGCRGVPPVLGAEGFIAWKFFCNFLYDCLNRKNIENIQRSHKRFQTQKYNKKTKTKFMAKNNKKKTFTQV